MIRHGRVALLLTVALVGATNARPVEAAIFRFDTSPFAGTNVLQTPGRQFVGNEAVIPLFNLANDVISIDPTAFGISSSLRFYNGLAGGLPVGGVNLIVLQDIDADANPANGILNNAGLSANLIAAEIDIPTPGFFVYFNSPLNLNRLAFSSDLSSATADIKIVARFTGQTGLAGADALPRFTASNFAAAVPEAGSWAMMIAGFGLSGAAVRRRGRRAIAA